VSLRLSQTARKDRENGQRAEPRLPHLFVVLEATRPTAPGSRHALASIDEVTVSRGAERASSREIASGVRRLHLAVPDRWMSRPHVRLVRRGERCELQDLGSTNGVTVNGSLTTGAELRDGDVIGVGHTFLVYRSALATPRDEPDDLVVESAPGDRPASLDPALRARFAELTRIAQTTVSVVISGETGTGKERIARHVHEASARSGPFVAVNCGGIPRSLLEGELFGHRRGAFTGAIDDRVGLVATSDRGTLFLDEVAEMPLDAQAVLLRVLQQREVMALGSTKAARVDLRVVAATHVDLDRAVAAGAFRDDLAARLYGYRIVLPPLRERRQDLGILVGAILADLGAPTAVLGDDAAAELLARSWRRNMRELRSCLETALALAGGEPIQRRHLGASDPATAPATDDDAGDDRPGDGDRALRQQLAELLAEHRGNVTAVARAIGKARTQVQRWLRRFGLDAERYRG
jgi:DNA-binding NtrC family response regulator